MHHLVNPLSTPLEHPALLLCCAGPPSSRSQPAGCGRKAERNLGMSAALVMMGDQSQSTSSSLLGFALLFPPLPHLQKEICCFTSPFPPLQLGLHFINSPQKTSLNAIPRHIPRETFSNVHHILEEMLSLMPLPPAPKRRTAWWQLQQTHGGMVRAEKYSVFTVISFTGI